jgi:hypothetical protein
VSFVNVLGATFLVFAVLVHVIVIAMCRAAARSDRSFSRSLQHSSSSDVIIDLDGVARGLTPPVGVGIRSPIPTPRNGVPVVPGGGAEPNRARRDLDGRPF